MGPKYVSDIDPNNGEYVSVNVRDLYNVGQIGQFVIKTPKRITGKSIIVSNILKKFEIRILFGLGSQIAEQCLG